jgi:hypothetical protein
MYIGGDGGGGGGGGIISSSCGGGGGGRRRSGSIVSLSGKELYYFSIEFVVRIVGHNIRVLHEGHVELTNGILCKRYGLIYLCQILHA